MKAILTMFMGVYTAVLTPMREDYSCDHKELARHCKDLVDRGCNGIVLFGTTGEGSSFSVEEREAALKELIALGVDPQKIIFGISCCAVPDAVRLASLAVNLNCSAVLIVPPFFFKNVNEDGVIAYYREIIQRVESPDLKVFLYHIPQYSGVPITLNIIKALRDEFPENVIGLKESEGNLPLTKEILKAIPGFAVFVGNETHISEAVQLGAVGGISGIANAYPELICSLYAYGKDRQQTDNNEKVCNIIQAIKKYPLFPAIKSVVEHQKGRAWHVVRPPLIPLNQSQRRELADEIVSLDQVTG